LNRFRHRDLVPGKPQRTPLRSSTLRGMQCTVVLRNIACSLTPEKVKQILDTSGLRGTFSFVCVPCIPTGRSNLGYAFVCFRASEHVEECRRLFQGKVFGCTSSKKVCEVVLANGEKDVKALAQMSRRQRRGRQLGLLMCDAAGEPCASAERAVVDEGARLAAAASRPPSSPGAKSTQGMDASAGAKDVGDGPAAWQDPSASSNPWQLAMLACMTDSAMSWLAMPTSTPDSYIPGAQFLFDYLASLYVSGAKVPPGLADGVFGAPGAPTPAAPQKVAIPAQAMVIPPHVADEERGSLMGLGYLAPPPGLAPAKANGCPASPAVAGDRLSEPLKVDAGPFLAGFDGSALTASRRPWAWAGPSTLDRRPSGAAAASRQPHSAGPSGAERSPPFRPSAVNI